MTSVRMTAALGLALVALPITLHGQRAIELLSGGIAAYERLDLDGAARLLRAALTSDSGHGLATNLQARGLAYLGATELYRSKPDSARAAFRRLLELDAAYRPDAKVFPPQVTDLFEIVRRGSHPLTVGLPPLSRFRVRSESLYIRVQGPGVATGARARLEREDGALVRGLFEGTLRDSLTLAWDGLDASARAVPPGRYRLVVALVGNATTTGQAIRVPLTIEQSVAPSASPTISPTPAPAAESQVRPAPNPGRGWPALVVGIAAATAAATLPHAVSPGVDDGPRRLVVPIAIGLAGVVGFVLQRRQPAPPRSVVAPRTVVAPRSAPGAPAGDITLIVHAGPVPAQ